MSVKREFVIAGLRGRDEFPDKHFAAACNTHNLYTLLKLARLEQEPANAIHASNAGALHVCGMRQSIERGTTMDTDVLVEGTMATGMVDCGRQSFGACVAYLTGCQTCMNCCGPPAHALRSRCQ